MDHLTRCKRLLRGNYSWFSLHNSLPFHFSCIPGALVFPFPPKCTLSRTSVFQDRSEDLFNRTDPLPLHPFLMHSLPGSFYTRSLLKSIYEKPDVAETVSWRTNNFKLSTLCIVVYDGGPSFPAVVSSNHLHSLAILQHSTHNNVRPLTIY